ncbi:hypothetical protein QBL07_020640 [Gordonia rubripertincta]|uniref:Cadherin domain-containing protein n=2 Tax=Gordonia rubripertincta TaxID=36822 RepID=A0AAW6RBM4_GORRU|nr:hypothetical protein [Gordonia rubripertincta]MDG6781861.1 hypothetical protein [Gordonia rubripertincta]NKY64893.1 hypothetical protein [Gordonia rubripertincta]GAB85268.1 hypothetical protein GORBP_055_00950 [Gordonia rubripertincta NBRC 101908]
MTMTTARPRRVRALAVAAAVGLALYWGGQAPATAEPSPFGVGSHSVDAPGSGGDSGGGDSSGGDSGGSGSGSGGGDSGGSDSSGSGSGSGGSGGGSGGSDSGSGSTRSGDGDSGDGDSAESGPASGSDTGTTPDSDPGDTTIEPSGPVAENDTLPQFTDPPAQSEGSSAGEPAVPPAAEETEPDPESSSDSTPNHASLDVDVHEKPGPAEPDAPDRAGDGADTTSPPAADGRRPGDTALAARADDVTRSKFDRDVSPSGGPPPWAPLLETSTPPVAVAPQPARTGAIGILTFLGINILGGGSTGAASPAPWTLLWWIRRFGTQGPVASAETPATPYTFGLATDPDQFLTAADGPDSPGPVPQFALVGGLVFGSALLSRKRMSAAVTVIASGPTPTIPVPDSGLTEPIPAPGPAPAGVLHGSLRFTDADGNPIPTTLHGVTPIGDQTFRTASGGVLTYDAPAGTYTYKPALQARITATAPGAPESARFDSVTITADDGRGGTTPITVALPITSPYSLGQVTVPGSQIDEVVVGHEDVVFVTTQREDGCTQVSVVRPKTMTVASVPIAGSPTEPDRGVVLGPDGRAHQLTELTEIAGDTIRTSVRITRIDPTGAASTTGPILGLPADHLRFDDAGIGHLLTTWPDDDGRTYTYLTVLDHDGTASTFPRVPGAHSRLILTSSGKVLVATSDAEGTRLLEAGPGGLAPAGQVLDGEGGDLWARREDSLYFARHHGDPTGTPVATLAIRHPDGSLDTVDGIPGRVASVVPTETAVYVVSRSPGSVVVTVVRPDGRRSSVTLSGVSDCAAVAGPHDHLYLPLANPLTGESTVVGISPDAVSRVMAAGIGSAGVRADESGTVFLTTTTLTPDGEDATTVTVICGDGTTSDTRVDGSPISVHFDRHGAAHLPMLTTDPASGDPVVSLAVLRPDSAPVVSATVVGEPAGPPAITDDGRTYLPLTRFCPETRWPTTILTVFHTDGSAVEAGGFHGHSTHGPAITLDGDVVLLTHDAGTTTIRPLKMTTGGGRHARSSTPAMVFDVTPTISDINPETGVISGSVTDLDDTASTLSYLTTDTQVTLDSASGAFIFTPTMAQRQTRSGPTAHDFTVLVSDASGSSTVISVSVPIVPAKILEALE